MVHVCKKLQSGCRTGWMLLLAAAMLIVSAPVLAQQRATVTGTVTDQSGQPVIGATVIEQGTTNGATTGVDGTYTLKLKGGGNSANLIFQSLGFVSQTVALNGRTKVDVKLSEDAVALDAVVAIGYGTVKQKDLTTAVSIVKTDDLARRPITSASGALQGKAAGVQVIQPNGSPGQGMVVRVRGASSISSSNDPLYVVDGVPVGEGNYAIAYLSPNEIESMQVLKDASSAAIYGSRAANGVVLITTKQGSRKMGPEISFSTFVGISKVTKSFDVLNARQYRELMEENGAVSGLPETLTDVTDWFDETYSTGVNQNYQFSISNGDENSSYYLGGGYTNENGYHQHHFVGPLQREGQPRQEDLQMGFGQRLDHLLALHHQGFHHLGTGRQPRRRGRFGHHDPDLCADLGPRESPAVLQQFLRRQPHVAA